MKALIVDDDLDLADVVAFTMRRAGFETLQAHNGLLALERWEAESPDLIILDLNLPGLDGLAVCQRIRARADTPIIVLSIRSEEDDVVQALRLGADDYIVKLFSPRQLVARAEALMRRAGAPVVPAAHLEAGDLSLDLTRREVYRQGELLAQLTRLECRLLEALMLNAGQVMSAEALIDHVWGPAGGDRVMLKQLVSRLRRKIDRDPSGPGYLETVPGVGYGLVMEDDQPR